MNSSQLAQIKAHFAAAFSELTDEQLLALSIDGYVSIRETARELVAA